MKVKQFAKLIGIKEDHKVYDVTREFGTAESLTEARINCLMVSLLLSLYVYRTVPTFTVCKGLNIYFFPQSGVLPTRMWTIKVSVPLLNELLLFFSSTVLPFLLFLHACCPFPLSHTLSLQGLSGELECKYFNILAGGEGLLSVLLPEALPWQDTSVL